MKTYTHRSEKLDALLNKRVRITTKNNSIHEGILFYNEKCCEPLFLRSNMYYLRLDDGNYMGFFKRFLRRVKEV